MGVRRTAAITLDGDADHHRHPSARSLRVQRTSADDDLMADRANLRWICVEEL